MIPLAFITEWSNHVPWQTNEQVEQDLLICRILCELFSDTYLANNLAFRGGTALHKLYLFPPPRYSEDIDLVQIANIPIGPIIDRIRKRLDFLGEPIRRQKENNFTLYYRFESESLPIRLLRLKIEINCREHFSVLGFTHFPFRVKSSWFSGECKITTYTLEEILGTKLRALYQRRKGRDLFDLYQAFLKKPHLDKFALLKCYSTYMSFSISNIPSKKIFIQNMEEKMQDDEFLGDIKALIRPEESYHHSNAYEFLKVVLFEKLDQIRMNK